MPYPCSPKWTFGRVSVDITIRREIICPPNPVQHPLALRAEMGSGRGSTAAAAVLQEKLLSTFLATVTIHSPDLCPSSALKLPSVRSAHTLSALRTGMSKHGVGAGGPTAAGERTRHSGSWGREYRNRIHAGDHPAGEVRRFSRYGDTRTGSRRVITQAARPPDLPTAGCQSRLEGGEPPRCRLHLSHDRHDLV